MNLFNKPYHAVLLVLGLFFSGIATSYASSAFSGSASFTFTPSASSDFTDIDISHLGSFIDDGSSTSGDAVINPSYFFLSADAGHFSVLGSVNEGEVSSRHVADFDVIFTNSTNLSHSLSLTLSYILDATASGEFANSVVQFSYGNAGYAEVEANQFENVKSFSSDEVLNFDLAGNSSYTLNFKVAVTGDLLGTTPVPLPPAAWSFLIGIAGLAGLRKRV